MGLPGVLKRDLRDFQRIQGGSWQSGKRFYIKHAESQREHDLFKTHIEQVDEAYRTCKTMGFHMESENHAPTPFGFIWNVGPRLQSHVN